MPKAAKQIDGPVRMVIANHLREIDEAFAAIATHAEVKAKPFIIGESDPDGCAACKGVDRDYRNGTMYSCALPPSSRASSTSPRSTA